MSAGTRTGRRCGDRILPWLAAIGLLAGCGDDAATVEQASQVCEAVQQGRFEAAIRASEGGAGARGAARDVAECRCLAQISLRDPAGCVAELAPLVASPAARDWVPHPMLTKLLLRAGASGGEAAAAATLARRAAPRHRDDLEILQLELDLRMRVEDPAEVLADVEARLGEDPAWLPQRLVLAFAWIDRARTDAALRVLGETPPPIDHRYALPWYEARIQSHARDGDLSGVRATFDAWRAAGWDPLDLAARYALRLSVDHLTDPEHSTIELLRAAIAREDALQDRNVVWGLHRRLIVETLAAGRPEEALAAYDAAVDHIDLEGITRGELERAVREQSGDAALPRTARLRLEAPPEARGGRWRLSPDAGHPPDAGYRSFTVGTVEPIELEVRTGLHATRWLLEDAEGALLASGSVWPEPGRTAPVRASVATGPRTIADGIPSATRTPADRTPSATRAPADGRRRVFAILADCADWRLTEYLRMRGELPFQDRLFAEGYRAVLESRPAFTAAAMQTLVWPSVAHAPTGSPSLRWMHQLGLELAGLEAVGRNPLDALAWVLPRRAGLFETLGAGPSVTANMLLAHGDIEAGRHAELIGPHGARRRLATQTARRALDAGERARHPQLLADPDTRRFAETIAAEMDAAAEIARGGEVDFLFLRLEALDLMTHAHFASIDGAGQDDGRGPLFDAYRYIDARLAELHALLDGDDWLVYLSDHGIRSAMRHEEDAIFAVIGEGVPQGRAPGQPALAGVPRALADMLSVETPWPETGAAPWLAHASRSAAPTNDPASPTDEPAAPPHDAELASRR